MHRQSQRVGVAGRVRVERGSAVLRRALCWFLLHRDGDGLAVLVVVLFFVVEEGESCALEGGREGQPASTLKGGPESLLVGEPAFTLEDKPTSSAESQRTSVSVSGTQTQTYLWSYGFYLFWGFFILLGGGLRVGGDRVGEVRYG